MKEASQVRPPRGIGSTPHILDRVGLTQNVLPCATRWINHACAVGCWPERREDPYKARVNLPDDPPAVCQMRDPPLRGRTICMMSEATNRTRKMKKST